MDQALARIGDAIGEPSRAAMLVALMGGVALPASELARIAKIAPATASDHLRQLRRAGLITQRARGRHRYFELASAQVADVVERVAALASSRPVATGAFAMARTCYSHLAGRIAVALWNRATDRGWIRWEDDAVRLLPAGQRALDAVGLELSELAGKSCLDWTERVPHVSGPLGTKLYDALRANKWVVPVEGARELRITVRGREGFRALGLA
jgi:DNA-binding transcriptional ArsR family regulator